MKKIIHIATFAFLLTASHQAQCRDMMNITLPGADGAKITKTVTKTWLPSDGIPKVCGTPLYYAGMAEDGVRKLNCDGTGEYVDGTNIGTITWYYAISPTDKSNLFIKTFSEWGMGPAYTDDPAAVIYMTFKGGNLDGQTFGAVIGVAQGQIQLSPNDASRP